MLEKFRPTADAFVEDFYRHLFAHQETARFLQDPRRVERLQKMQRDHFESLLEAEWGEEYIVRRQRVGQTHADVGLDADLFLGAYSQYVKHCSQVTAAERGEEARDTADEILSLIKVIFLDVGLTLDAYFAQSTEKLRQALDLYWKANDDLRRFAQLTSHDLKTPIATVANLCDEAVDEFGDQMPEEAHKLIESARDRAFRNSAMLDEILATTIASHSEQDRDEVPLSEVMGEAIDRLRPLIRKKQIEVIQPKTLPVVFGTKARLQEAFYNLLSNAVKFIDREPGSGLGLYFTMSLIDRDGGRIWAESSLGEGSRFCVELERPPEI